MSEGLNTALAGLRLAGALTVGPDAERLNSTPIPPVDSEKSVVQQVQANQGDGVTIEGNKMSIKVGGYDTNSSKVTTPEERDARSAEAIRLAEAEKFAEKLQESTLRYENKHRVSKAALDELVSGGYLPKDTKFAEMDFVKRSLRVDENGDAYSYDKDTQEWQFRGDYQHDLELHTGIVGRDLIKGFLREGSVSLGQEVESKIMYGDKDVLLTTPFYAELHTPEGDQSQYTFAYLPNGSIYIVRIIDSYNGLNPDKVMMFEVKLDTISKPSPEASGSELHLRDRLKVAITGGVNELEGPNPTLRNRVSAAGYRESVVFSEDTDTLGNISFREVPVIRYPKSKAKAPSLPKWATQAAVRSFGNKADVIK